MFEVEKQIASWRNEMSRAGIAQPEVLDELESHLREDVDRQTRAGADLQAAFAAATEHIGPAKPLIKEFRKISVLASARHFFFTLAGIPNQSLPMNTSNSNSNLEAAWATYLKAGIFLLPAVCMWLASCFFVLPKLRQIYSGTIGHEFPTLLNVMLALTAHGVIVTLALGAALFSLEWRAAGWPRYRRAVVGVGTFLANALVLITCFVMVVLALIAAANLYHK